MNYSEFSLLRVKDIKLLLQVQDDRTARKYLQDIKEHTGCPTVLYCHFKHYFKTK